MNLDYPFSHHGIAGNALKIADIRQQNILDSGMVPETVYQLLLVCLSQKLIV